MYYLVIGCAIVAFMCLGVTVCGTRSSPPQARLKSTNSLFLVVLSRLRWDADRPPFRHERLLQLRHWPGVQKCAVRKRDQDEQLVSTPGRTVHLRRRKAQAAAVNGPVTPSSSSRFLVGRIEPFRLVGKNRGFGELTCYHVIMPRKPAGRHPTLASSCACSKH